MSIEQLQTQFSGLTITAAGKAEYNGQVIAYTSETDLQSKLEAIDAGSSDTFGNGDEAAADDELTPEQLALANSYASSIDTEISTGNGLVNAIKDGISAINNLFSQVRTAAQKAQKDYTNSVESQIEKIQNDTSMTQEAKADAIANAFSSVSFDSNSVNNIYSQASVQMGTLSSSIGSLNSSNGRLNGFNNDLNNILITTNSSSDEITSLSNTLTLGQEAFTANSGFYDSIFSKPSEIQSDINSGTSNFQSTRITVTGAEQSNANAAVESAKIAAENEKETAGANT